MVRDVRAYLWDALEAGKSILTFTHGLDLASYESSDLVRAATERKFLVIGESLNQLSKLDQAISTRVPDLPKIVAFRNQLIHGYATVNPATVWNIVQQSLPPLVEVLQDLLDHSGDAIDP